MAKAKFTKTKISGIVTVIPHIKKCIDDEVELFGGDAKQIERIKKTIGLNTRYVSDENTTTADLCQDAASTLLKGLKMDRSEVDGLIFVSQTPDYYSQPFTAACLHGKMGLPKDCAAFDVNLGCSGYVYGLWLANMMVSSGTAKNVLLLVGDTTTKIVNPRDRATASLFGDAGTATMIQRSDKESPSYFVLHTDGSGWEHIIVPAGGCRIPRTPETSVEVKYEDGNVRSKENLYMNGAEVFTFSVGVEPPAIMEMLEYSGKKLEDIDHIFFHQANRYIISNIMRRLKFPLEKAPADTVEKYGNQSSASIPSTICDTIADKVSSGKEQVLMSGFGVGFSWASCVLTLENIFCKFKFFGE